MSTNTLIDLDGSVLTNNVSLAAYLVAGIEAATGEASAPAPNPKSEDVDGCDVAVEHAKLDDDLPATEGGVA